MSIERFIELAAKKKSREINLVEQRELSRILEENPDLQLFLESADQFFETPVFSDGNFGEQGFVDQHWEQFERRTIFTETPAITPFYKQRRFSYGIIGLAASLLLLIVLKFALPKNKAELLPEKENTVSTNCGSKSKITLPDGSSVWLNADSKISYPKSFGADTREVFLMGEAYFDVAHDAGHPFIIHSGDIDVRVLGTAFNVRNYKNEKSIEVSLIRGKIELSMKGQIENKILLNPSQKLVISKTASQPDVEGKAVENEGPKNLFTLTHVNVRDSLVAETSWMENKAVFINRQLDDIMEELDRRFNTNTIFKDEDVKKYRYTIYTNDFNLKEIMEVLKLSKGFTYQLSNDEIIISK